MNRDSLEDALSHISDKHIAQASSHKKRRLPPYFGAIAACLAAIITLWIFLPERNAHLQNDAIPPLTGNLPMPQSNLLAAPEYPKMAAYPLDQSNWQQWSRQEDQWRQTRNALHSAPQGYADSLIPFWKQSIPIYLTSDQGGNTLYSPISLYMALSILAQSTDGQTRQEILTLLGAESMEDLALQARLVFENQYENDGVHTSILGNSLWLDDMYPFDQDCVDEIAENYYASVYQGPLESPEMNTALKDWLNSQTGGLLEDSIQNLEPMDPLTALVIASTINYRCKWTNTFSPDRNTQDIFHSPQGDQTVTYLHQTIDYGTFYQGEGYCATYLSLDDRSRMWLILPDEGTTPEAVLADGLALRTVFGEDDLDSRTVRIHLSLPKFDVTADLDLIPGLQDMGLSEVFDTDNADFSAICPEDRGIHLGSAKQGVRVCVDEDGLTGVAYTVLVAPGNGMPPSEEVDFVLDRPFLFVVESGDGLPLFTGVINKA